jgi:hypothetical protein
MSGDDYAENEIRRLRSITAVANLVRAVVEKSEMYGLNEGESVAINTLQKQVNEQSRIRLEEIFDTLEEAWQRKQKAKNRESGETGGLGSVAQRWERWLATGRASASDCE